MFNEIKFNRYLTQNELILYFKPIKPQKGNLLIIILKYLLYPRKTGIVLYFIENDEI